MNSMDQLVAEATNKNTISFYEEKLNTLGISKEEMSRLLQSDEDRWKERVTFPVLPVLLAAGLAGVIFSALLGIGQ